MAMLFAATILLFSSSTWSEESPSYGASVVHKASHGFANLTHGFIEIPKNVSNLTSEHNVFCGITLGLLRGAVHAVSRTLVGALELISSPIPSNDFVTPGYVWERFSEDTRYFGLHYPYYWTHYGFLDEGDKSLTE
jgi:putative exosortase-associated protein (TIGR04073 family)